MFISYCSIMLSHIFSTPISTDITLTLIWLTIAFLLLLLELSSPGLFLFLSFSSASFCAALAAYYEYSIAHQWIVFFIGLAISFFLLKTFAKKQKPSHSLKTNTDSLIGQVALVTQTIAPHTPGRAKTKNEEWPALERTNLLIIEKNTLVRITSITGNKLLVEPIKD